MRGNTGNDKLAGSFDNDMVEGGQGNDSLGGGMGRDLLKGEDGNDSLGGADGNDLLFGGDGNDIVNGAHGNDTLEGGAGADVFFFNNNFSSGRDVIRDFEPGLDHLRLVGVNLGPAEGRLDKLHLSEGSFWGVSGTWMKFGRNDIFLERVEISDLDQNDFLFS